MHDYPTELEPRWRDILIGEDWTVGEIIALCYDFANIDIVRRSLRHRVD